MKAKVDGKGRIVIPFEARQELEIEPGTEVEFEVNYPALKDEVSGVGN
jgi:AbrB family looped-hinge helix DNA binding protein